MIVYSLGDICIRLESKKCHYGIALKFVVGLNEKAEWVIGDLGWSFTECHLILKTDYQTNLLKISLILPLKAGLQPAFFEST